MVSLNPPVCNFGQRATDFNLLGVDGNRYNLANSMGKNGLLVMFISNHCPYVKAIKPRLVADCHELLQYGIKTIAIQSNDTENYPDDSYERMREEAKLFNFSFPYVLDDTLELQYRGRFDAAGRGEPPVDNPRDLFHAMKRIAETQKGPQHQAPSIGCSIKWFPQESI